VCMCAMGVTQKDHRKSFDTLRLLASPLLISSHIYIWLFQSQPSIWNPQNGYNLSSFSRVALSRHACPHAKCCSLVSKEPPHLISSSIAPPARHILPAWQRLYSCTWQALPDPLTDTSWPPAQPPIHGSCAFSQSLRRLVPFLPTESFHPLA
jgi:hypothetical protein